MEKSHSHTSSPPSRAGKFFAREKAIAAFITSFLKEHFADVDIQNDLMGAAMVVSGHMPGMAAEFAREFDASYAAIVQCVYRSPSPSAYLGSLAPFIVKRYDRHISSSW